jgi:hypothetical protein
MSLRPVELLVGGALQIADIRSSHADVAHGPAAKLAGRH